MSCDIFVNRCSQEKPIGVMQVIRTIFVEATKMILSPIWNMLGHEFQVGFRLLLENWIDVLDFTKKGGY